MCAEWIQSKIQKMLKNHIILWVCVGADRYHQKDTLLLLPFELCYHFLIIAIFHPFGILDARDGISSKMIFGLNEEV